MKKIQKTYLALLFFVISFNSFCQIKNNTNTSKIENEKVNNKAIIYDNDYQEVIEIQKFIDFKINQEFGKNHSYSNVTWLKSLLFETQPSVYCYNKEVNIYGKNPNNLYTDITSLQIIESLNIPHSIELVRIAINNRSELNTVIDLNLLASFKKIKYIYIVSNVEISNSDIVKMIQNLNFQYEVFYSINNSDSSSIIK